MPPPEPYAMQPADLIISARWIVPVEPDGRVLEDHALVVRDGRILDLLPPPRPRSAIRPWNWSDGPHHVLLPDW